MPHRNATGDGSIIVSDGTATGALPLTSFQLTWPAGEDVPHSIPSLPAYQLTPPAIEGEAQEYVTVPESTDVGGASSTTGTQTTVDNTPPRRPSFPPRFSRAFSTPSSSQLRHLRHPSRTAESTRVVVPANPLPPPPPAVPPHFQELALELADSVQMVIQTLIQLSPPHLLDPAKEQLSACTLQLPTPSVSALLTTMKNLNYMSANLPTLSTPSPPSKSSGQSSPDGAAETPLIAEIENVKKVGSAEGEEIITSYPTSFATDDFDIGEVMQSVADVLSGLAAQAGVDLVLFHADVGMKHVSVRGDECGISYALCHVLRQIITTCHKGDTIELGLYISAPMSSPSPRRESTSTVDDRPSSPSFVTDMAGPLMCTFDITHKFAPPSHNMRPAGDTDASNTQGNSFPRPAPQFSTLILQRLLRYVKATLQTDVPPSNGKTNPSTQRSYELSVLLSPGNPTSEDIVDDTSERQPFPGFNLPKEPTLDELANFVQSESENGLKGKKVVFHACESSSFAHHLTSYLTVWGLDVSHMPTDHDSEDAPLTDGEWLSDSENEPFGLIAPKPRRHAGSMSSNDQSGDSLNKKISPIPESFEGEILAASDGAESADHDSSGEDYGSARQRGSNQGYGLTDLSETSFVIIDDDVKVLRRRLRQIKRMVEMRNYQVYQQPGIHPQVQNLKKRPSLAPHHRPKSSPAVRMVPMSAVVSSHAVNPNAEGAAGPGGVSTSPGGTPLPTPSITGSPSATTLPGSATPSVAGRKTPTIMIDPSQVVVVHFTSLANYKVVKDTIQAILYNQPGTGYFGFSPALSAYGATSPGWTSNAVPEILVIPKPAGPRRFLTALHTAVRKPYVDPFFTPIATSPMSPSTHYGWNSGTGGGPPGGPVRNSSYISAGRKSSGSVSLSNGRVPTLSSTTINGGTVAAISHPSAEGGEAVDSVPPSAASSGPAVPMIPMLPSGMTGNNNMGLYTPLPPSPIPRESLEYFAENTVSPSAGMLLHSPDGRPAGIYFQPQSSRNHAAAMSSNIHSARSDSSYFGRSITGALGDGRRTSSSGSHDGIPMHGTRSNSINVPKTGRMSSAGQNDLAHGQNVDNAGTGISPPNGPVTPGASQPINARHRPGSVMRASSTTSVVGPRKLSVGGDDPGRPAFTRMPSGTSGNMLGRTHPTLGRRAESMPPAQDLKLPLALHSGMPSPSLATTGDHAFSSYTSPVPHTRQSRRPSLEPSTPRVTAASPQPSPVSAVSPATQPNLTPIKKVNRRSSSEVKAAGGSPVTPGGQPKKKVAPEVGSIVPPINVLIAEDNPINQTILSTFMKRKKIKYAVAKNGQEAVEKWKTGGYHLILMDIQMPVKDGIEATKEIRQLEKERNIGIFPTTPPIDAGENGKTHPTLPIPTSPYRSSVIIVALTASNLKSDRVEALAAGCNDFLTKPVSLVWLNNKVIEWGSIKVLEMFQDPATAKLFSSQSAKTKSVASHLKLPPRAPSPINPSVTAAEAGSEGPGSMARPSLNVLPPSEDAVPQVEEPSASTNTPEPIQQGQETPKDSTTPKESEKPDQASSMTPTTSQSSFSSIQHLDDEAIRRHIAETQKLEDCKRHSNAPVLLGERAMNPETSSTSIASVLYNTPPIGGSDPETMISPEVFVPVLVPSAAPGPGPSPPTPPPSSSIP
ncbi:ssk1 response regulator receiver [Tulasnella sp. 418]|nr:ssk1 response regulator receiver [Tulasnella sp. 418]